MAAPPLNPPNGVAVAENSPLHVESPGPSTAEARSTTMVIDGVAGAAASALAHSVPVGPATVVLEDASGWPPGGVYSTAMKPCLATAKVCENVCVDCAGATALRAGLTGVAVQLIASAVTALASVLVSAPLNSSDSPSASSFHTHSV